jgi:hypothetical protein
MEYQVTGVNRQTGEDVELFVEASSFREAERKANLAGVVVADVRECHELTSVTKEVATEKSQNSQSLKGLGQCKVCRKDVASTASVCPHCGVDYPVASTVIKMSTGIRIKTIVYGTICGTILSVFVLVLLGLVLFIFDPRDSSQTKSTSPRDSSQTKSTSSSSSRSQEWFSGGTLHSSTIGEWDAASYRNKLATAADWCTTIDPLPLMDTAAIAVLKQRAVAVLVCTDIAIDGYIEGSGGIRNVESEKVGAMALICIYALRDEWIGW